MVTGRAESQRNNEPQDVRAPNNALVGFLLEGLAEVVATTRRMAKGEMVMKERRIGKVMDIYRVLNLVTFHPPVPLNEKNCEKKRTSGRGRNNQQRKSLCKSFQDYSVKYNLIQEIANAPSRISIE